MDLLLFSTKFLKCFHLIRCSQLQLAEGSLECTAVAGPADGHAVQRVITGPRRRSVISVGSEGAVVAQNADVAGLEAQPFNEGAIAQLQPIHVAPEGHA